MLSVGAYQLTLLALIGHKHNESIAAVESVLPAVRADLDHRICWILPVNRMQPPPYARPATVPLAVAELGSFGGNRLVMTRPSSFPAAVDSNPVHQARIQQLPQLTL